jgi:hypothetical protein
MRVSHDSRVLKLAGKMESRPIVRVRWASEGCETGSERCDADANRGIADTGSNGQLWMYSSTVWSGGGLFVHARDDGSVEKLAATLGLGLHATAVAGLPAGLGLGAWATVLTPTPLPTGADW